MANGEYKSVDEAYTNGFDNGVRYVYNVLRAMISDNDNADYYAMVFMLMDELGQVLTNDDDA